MEELDKLKTVLTRGVIDALIVEMGEGKREELEQAYTNIRTKYEQSLRIAVQNISIANGDYSKFGYNCDCGPYQNYMSGYNRVVDMLSSSYD